MNDRQKKFCIEYVKNFNASEAARNAGYNGRSNTAATQLMSNIVIKTQIAELSKKILDEPVEELKLKIRNEYQKIAFSVQKKIKMSDKLTALAQLAKYTELIKDSPKLSVNFDISKNININIGFDKPEVIEP